jgi:hypothetical protein
MPRTGSLVMITSVAPPVALFCNPWIIPLIVVEEMDVVILLPVVTSISTGKEKLKSRARADMELAVILKPASPNAKPILRRFIFYPLTRLLRG